MFIYVMYKDPPELSTFRRQSTDEDFSLEKRLLVNPKCLVRVMLEYIRKQCKLAAQTNFDLCDEGGFLKGLFGYPTFARVDNVFDHKRTYYLIVFSKPHGETEKACNVFPQVNRESKLYADLQIKVKKCLAGELHPETGGGSGGKSTPGSKKNK